MAAQNYTIRTYHIKAGIEKTQQNSKYKLCGDRKETINHILSECSKLARKECKTRYYWVGKVIHWELCKKFKFDHSNKWYMHNLESVLGNKMQKSLWDFEIQNGSLNLGQTTTPSKNRQKRELAEMWTLLSRLTTKLNWKKTKRKINTLTVLWNLKKKWNTKVMLILITIDALSTVKKRLLQGLEGSEIREQVETVQTRVLLRSATILRIFQVTWGNLLSLQLQWEITG